MLDRASRPVNSKYRTSCWREFYYHPHPLPVYHSPRKSYPHEDQPLRDRWTLSREV